MAFNMELLAHTEQKAIKGSKSDKCKANQTGENQQSIFIENKNNS